MYENQERDFIQQKALKCDSPLNQSEHVKIAKEMAVHITGFSPVMQLEMVKFIKGYVAEEMKSNFERQEKQLYELKEIISNL